MLGASAVPLSPIRIIVHDQRGRGITGHAAECIGILVVVVLEGEAGADYILLWVEGIFNGDTERIIIDFSVALTGNSVIIFIETIRCS